MFAPSIFLVQPMLTSVPFSQHLRNTRQHQNRPLTAPIDDNAKGDYHERNNSWSADRGIERGNWQ